MGGRGHRHAASNRAAGIDGDGRVLRRGDAASMARCDARRCNSPPRAPRRAGGHVQQTHAPIHPPAGFVRFVPWRGLPEIRGNAFARKGKRTAGASCALHHLLATGAPPRRACMRPSVRWQLRPRPHPTHVPAKPLGWVASRGKKVLFIYLLPARCSHSSTKPNRVVRWWGRAGGNTCRASRHSTAPRTRKVDRLTCQWATQGRDGGYRAQEFRRAMDGFGFHGTSRSSRTLYLPTYVRSALPWSYRADLFFFARREDSHMRAI
jgi:hypothetical protein